LYPRNLAKTLASESSEHDCFRRSGSIDQVCGITETQKERKIGCREKKEGRDVEEGWGLHSRCNASKKHGRVYFFQLWWGLILKRMRRKSNAWEIFAEREL